LRPGYRDDDADEEWMNEALIGCKIEHVINHLLGYWENDGSRDRKNVPVIEPVLMSPRQEEVFKEWREEGTTVGDWIPMIRAENTPLSTRLNSAIPPHGVNAIKRSNRSKALVRRPPCSANAFVRSPFLTS
jgi:hypothetical protein